MILLDTNVLSELMRPTPEAAVERWLAEQPAASVFISAITEAELRYGVALLPSGERRSALAATIEAMLAEDFGGRILPFDSPAAIAFAEIATARRQGRPANIPSRRPDRCHRPFPWCGACHPQCGGFRTIWG